MSIFSTLQAEGLTALQSVLGNDAHGTILYTDAQGANPVTLTTPLLSTEQARLKTGGLGSEWERVRMITLLRSSVANPEIHGRIILDYGEANAQTWTITRFDSQDAVRTVAEITRPEAVNSSPGANRSGRI